MLIMSDQEDLDLSFDDQFVRSTLSFLFESDEEYSSLEEDIPKPNHYFKEQSTIYENAKIQTGYIETWSLSSSGSIPSIVEQPTKFKMYMESYIPQPYYDPIYELESNAEDSFAMDFPYEQTSTPVKQLFQPATEVNMRRNCVVNLSKKLENVGYKSPRFKLVDEDNASALTLVKENIPPNSLFFGKSFDQRITETSPNSGICSFCCKNREPEIVYKSHSLKDRNGRLNCPILRKHVCEICGQSGDNAHTRRYCRYNIQTVSKALPVFRRLSNGAVTSCHNHK